jgi:hypothetical protein
MTIHYHGTPISPVSVLRLMAGRHFCVSHVRRDQIKHVKQIGQSLMFDNGAFTHYRQNTKPDWPAFYGWVDDQANRHNDWAVIPDVIDGSEAENNALLLQWPHGKKLGSPVWHLGESFKRLHDLAWAGYDRICFGSSGEYWQIDSYKWLKRVEAAFDLLCPHGGGQTPVAVHMLRGMSVAGSRFPFASVDSSGFARNHNRYESEAEKIAFLNRMDGANCPDAWVASVDALPDAFKRTACLYDGRNLQLSLVT